MQRLGYHTSIEGAQHGPKGLAGFLAFAKKAGAVGCQPSNFMLEDGKGGLLSAASIKDAFARAGENEDRATAGLLIDGISAHCPFWVHTTAWTESKTMRPFLPLDIAQLGTAAIERWAGEYILKLLDLCAALGVQIVPMFWGVAFGWELATGYPWGFYEGPGYDLVLEGFQRFLAKTGRIREHANALGIKLCHEIHPGTAAMCADDFLELVEVCNDDPCLGVNADPSHCWEGETWEQRFLKVGRYIYACHIKNHVIRPGFPLRSMEPDWKNRGMQFSDLATGEINLTRFVELLKQVGYPERYCELMGGNSAPLVTEAESAHRDLDETAQGAIAYTRDKLCFTFAGRSFEAGMGADA